MSTNINTRRNVILASALALLDRRGIESESFLQRGRARGEDRPG